MRRAIERAAIYWFFVGGGAFPPPKRSAKEIGSSSITCVSALGLFFPAIKPVRYWIVFAFMIVKYSLMEVK